MKFRKIDGHTRMAIRSLRERAARERRYLVSEFAQVSGLMPLLMKRRNGRIWTPDDRAELGRHLRRLSNLSPYLAVLILPGGLLMLPALAWWLDRRRSGVRQSAPVQR
jgi:hypothetical protein